MSQKVKKVKKVNKILWFIAVALGAVAIINIVVWSYSEAKKSVTQQEVVSIRTVKVLDNIIYKLNLNNQITQFGGRPTIKYNKFIENRWVVVTRSPEKVCKLFKEQIKFTTSVMCHHKLKTSNTEALIKVWAKGGPYGAPPVAEKNTTVSVRVTYKNK
jgi:hypothetical protein